MGDGRGAVVARLGSLFDGGAGEQAIQFEGRWTTWGDVGRVHAALATLLTAHDVPAGAAVAIVMRQRPALVAVELAVLAAGRTAVLVTPLQADRSLAADLAALAPAVVVAHPADWARCAAPGSLEIEAGDDLALRVRDAPGDLPPGPDLDAAVTVLTSGTTGPAKRLPVAWETFVQLGGGPDGRPPASGRGALILSLPLVTLGGLLTVSRLVFGGRPMSLLERFDVHAWAALVREHRPKVIGAPPPVVAMILDAGISPDHFEGVTAYVTSSAPVAPDVAAAFEERYGFPVLLGYGATEFLNSVTGWTGELWERFGRTKLGSVGRALPGVRLRVVDPDRGTELPAGEAGLLEVDPPQRAGHLPAGWLRTADRARLDADGFLWITGRADDVIVRGGFKVDLAQVEAALCEHPAVVAACAVGLSDARLGQVPAAVVRLDPASGQPPGETELVAWLRDRLAPYAVPVTIRAVDAIPQTSTFKPHRAAVIELLARSSLARRS